MNNSSHILVVDDEPEICDLVQDYLIGEGYTVRSTNDGAGMRRAMEQAPVDLVILDLKLPDEDGLTLARWLRENFRAGIIMLAHPSVGDQYHQEFAAGVAEDEAKVVARQARAKTPFATFGNCLKTEDFTRLEPTQLED